MVTLDALVVVTALPSVHRDLGGSFDTLHWTVNDSNSAFAAGIITAAAVGDGSAGAGSTRSGWGCSPPRPRHAPSHPAPRR